MDPRNLYYLRYKQGTQGVQSSLIVAASPQKAEEVGHAYCSQLPNRRFIRVEPAIVADESILETPDGAKPAEPQDVPVNGPITREIQAAANSASTPETTRPNRQQARASA